MIISLLETFLALSQRKKCCITSTYIQCPTVRELYHHQVVFKLKIIETVDAKRTLEIMCSLCGKLIFYHLNDILSIFQILVIQAFQLLGLVRSTQSYRDHVHPISFPKTSVRHLPPALLPFICSWVVLVSAFPVVGSDWAIAPHGHIT